MISSQNDFRTLEQRFRIDKMSRVSSSTVTYSTARTTQTASSNTSAGQRAYGAGSTSSRDRRSACGPGYSMDCDETVLHTKIQSKYAARHRDYRSLTVTSALHTSTRSSIKACANAGRTDTGAKSTSSRCRNSGHGFSYSTDCDELVLDTRTQSKHYATRCRKLLLTPTTVPELLDFAMRDVDDIGSFSPSHSWSVTCRDPNHDSGYATSMTSDTATTASDASSGWSRMFAVFVPSMRWFGQQKKARAAPSSQLSTSPSQASIASDQPSTPLSRSTTRSSQPSTPSNPITIPGEEVDEADFSSPMSTFQNTLPPAPFVSATASAATSFVSVFESEDEEELEEEGHRKPRFGPFSPPKKRDHTRPQADWYARVYKTTPMNVHTDYRLLPQLVPARLTDRGVAVCPEQLWSDKLMNGWPTPDEEHVQRLRKAMMPPASVLVDEVLRKSSKCNWPANESGKVVRERFNAGPTWAANMWSAQMWSVKSEGSENVLKRTDSGVGW